jgi:hypothetical protein
MGDVLMKREKQSHITVMVKFVVHLNGIHVAVSNYESMNFRRVHLLVKCALLFIIITSCGSQKNIRKKVLYLYAQNYFIEPPKNLKLIADSSLYVQFNTYFKFRADREKGESLNAAISSCMCNDIKASKKYFKLAYNYTTFDTSKLIYIPEQCIPIAKSAMKNHKKNPCDNLKDEKLTELRRIYYNDQSIRKGRRSSADFIKSDSLNFIAFKKILPYYIDNYYCLQLLDSIPNISLIYIHNPRQKGDRMLDELYKGIKNKKVSYQELESIFSSRYYRFPYLTNDSINFYCISELEIKKDTIDIFNSTLEIRSLASYIKRHYSDDNKVKLTYHQASDTEIVDDLIEELIKKGVRKEQIQIEYYKNSNLNCRIGIQQNNKS